MFLFLLVSICSAKFQVHVFDVGQADSQLILFPSGYSILIDLGENMKDYKPTNVVKVANKLETLLSSKHINVVVLTHYHVDHYGYYENNGLWYLFEKLGFTADKYIERDFGYFDGADRANCTEDTFKFNNVGEYSGAMLKWGCYASSLVDKTLLSSIRETAKICSHRQIDPPDSNSDVEIFISDGRGVLQKSGEFVNGTHKGEVPTPSENDYSIGIRIQYGDFVYVTSGDLDGTYARSFDSSINDIESAAKDIVGSVDVAHANHHGSKYSNNQAWLNVLTPTVSVISCGFNNSYNLPAPTSVSRMTNVSKSVIATEECNSDVVDPKYYEMNDDIIIIVDSDSSSEFTVQNPKGTYKKTYQIKKNKPKRVECVGDESEMIGTMGMMMLAIILIIFI